MDETFYYVVSLCVGLAKVWFSVAIAHWPRLWAFYLIHIYRKIDDTDSSF